VDAADVRLRLRLRPKIVHEGMRFALGRRTPVTPRHITGLDLPNLLMAVRPRSGVTAAVRRMRRHAERCSDVRADGAAPRVDQPMGNVAVEAARPRQHLIEAINVVDRTDQDRRQPFGADAIDHQQDASDHWRPPITPQTERCTRSVRASGSSRKPTAGKPSITAFDANVTLLCFGSRGASGPYTGAVEMAVAVLCGSPLTSPQGADMVADLVAKLPLDG